jgi:hypothetical protein
MGSVLTNSIVHGICSILSPFVGQNSQILALIVLITTGVFILLWLLSESKEGVVIWILRVGVAVGLLINIFSIPPMLGLPGICG